MESEVYSLCFMCSVRCPIKVTVTDGQVTWIEGNPKVAGMEGSLCPRGAAGIALVNDTQRLRTPLIRTGERGAGQWREASWEEALDFIAEKLKGVIDEHGPRSVAMGERTNLATHVSKTFMKAMGSPNHFTHDALCKGSANTAFRSLFGYTDAQMGADLKNAKHVVLYGRNIFEAIEVKGTRALMDALENGTRLTYIDPRVSVTATKSDRYWMIRPGTDLALNYALINIIIEEQLYDKPFVDRWVDGFEELHRFVEPYTPQWAQKETGIPAEQIIAMAREVCADRPNVIFHYGYRCAHHENEIYMRRSILMLNVLMGNLDAPGGLFFKKGPGEVGGKPARKLVEQTFPEITDIRFDKVGTPDFPLPDPAHGVPQELPNAILNEDPYPIRALLVNRFEPIGSIPDSKLTQRALDRLDLIVTIDINFSQTAWYSDVILPESTYLERTDCIQQANGLKPQMFLRKAAVEPRYDTKPAAEILQQLARRLGLDKFFPYQNMEELVEWQLEGTGFTIGDFADKGFVAYTQDTVHWDNKDGLKLKTPSGKIEFVSSLLENAGFPSFPPYKEVSPPPKNQFRLTTGRVALHTHVSTQNNLYLNELFPENRVWINQQKAGDLGIQNGDQVTIASQISSGEMTAKVTDCIHPEAVFMEHGFGQNVPKAGRSFGRGVSDAELMANVSDRIGGSPALHDTFVSIKKTA